VRERNKRLELVTARFALPQMLYAVPVQISWPFWEEHRLPTAQTFAMISRLTIGKFHHASSII